MNHHVKGYDLSKLTVLIVDKQAPMRTLLRTILREFGVTRIYDAATPEKGFEEFNDQGPDLVLVDWCPEFDGIGLVKRIRTDASSGFPQVPIVMVSAFGENNRIYQAVDAGVTEYLVKPVSANLLYLRIATVIDHPRPFVRAKDYIGPCRRRHKLPFAGGNRRDAAIECEADARALAAKRSNSAAAPAAAEAGAPARAA